MLKPSPHEIVRKNHISSSKWHTYHNFDNQNTDVSLLVTENKYRSQHLTAHEDGALIALDEVHHGKIRFSNDCFRYEGTIAVAQWIFLNELQKARSLYLDAYRGRYGEKSPRIETKFWDDVNWLDQETEKLILETIKLKEDG